MFYFISQGGLAAKNECSPCPPKYYCEKVGVTEFVSGNGSGCCDPGFYCKSGVSVKRPQPPLATGDGGVCPQGYYCPQCTDVPVPCPMGRYSNTVKLTNWTECELCDYGQFCGKTGLNKTSGSIIVLPLQQGATFKKPLFKNESEPFSYIMRPFMCYWCQFLKLL